ncbi:MAG: hypothetical protein CME75_07845 [Halomonas sp.]|nr:hypothetical protein [Halomonas sp.]
MTYRESESEKKDASLVLNPEKGIGTRISEISEVLGGRKKAAKAAGVALSTFHRWLAGDSVPALDSIARLAKEAGVSLDWIATGEGAMLPNKNSAEASNAPSDEFVYVTQMAGSNGVINRVHAFRADWLKEQGLEPQHLSVIENRDDAMAPTIKPGDLLLCQTYMHRDGSNIAIGLAPGELPPQDGIYMIRRGDKGPTSLRRMRLDMTGGVIISADADSSVQVHVFKDPMAGISTLARVVSFQRLV